MRTPIYLTIFFTVLISFFSCKYEEDYINNGQLTFSSDIIFFDTIFTSLGSTYQMPTIHNNNDKAIFISSVRLCQGESSQFRINIDGDTNVYLKDIEISAKDFKYIFIRVTIDPNSENSPFLVEDSIEFNINGIKQYMKLVAFGQNAYYHFPQKTITLPDNEITTGFYVHEEDSWDNDKPHIIYGTCLIENYTWNIQEGTKIHLSTDAQIVAGKNGALIVNGTMDAPVLFSGVRKDGHYSQLAGQWNRIWLSGESNDHKINWAIIQNGKTGLQIDSSETRNISLDINNSIIQNMANRGVSAHNSDIKASNLVISYCYQELLYLLAGGNYQFHQCTFANYWGSNYWDGSDFRRTPSVFVNYSDSSRNSFSADFSNNIITGNLSNELSIISPTTANLLFRNCFVKVSTNSLPDFFQNCIFNESAYFVDTKINDLRPTINSPFIGKGNAEIGNLVPMDLAGNPRKNPPTIGAYEYVEGE